MCMRGFFIGFVFLGLTLIFNKFYFLRTIFKIVLLYYPQIVLYFKNGRRLKIKYFLNIHILFN